MSSTFNIESLQKNSFIKPYSLKSRSKILQRNNIQKSLIAQLPQSVDLGQRLKQKDMQIQRLTHALQFYRNNEKNTQKSINPFDFYLNSDKKQQPANAITNKLEEYLFDNQIKELIQNSAKAYSLKLENQQLKDEIKYLQDEVSNLKQTKTIESGSQKQLNKRMKDSQIEINKLKSEIWSLQAEINKINYQNTELKKAMNSITKIKMGDQSDSILKVIQQSSDFKQESGISGMQSKLSQLRSQLQTKAMQCQNLRKKTTQLQAQIFKLTQNHTQLVKQHNSNSLSPSKNNNKRQSRFSMSSEKKATILNSISQFQKIDLQRYQLKITEKNKEYEQLYHKYQKIQSEKVALEDLNEELQRQRKFLADRLSEIEILQEGDQVVGEMENKLVLMSTELMRLGNLNRSKFRQTQQLTIQLKETIHKLELCTKQNIQKQKIILNYKEQITLIEQKIHEKSMLDDYDQQTLQEYKEQLLEKDKEISRLRYLSKELEEDIKTYELKMKVFEEKITRLQQENKELEKEIKQMEKNILAQSSVKHFNLEIQLEKYKGTCQGLESQIKSLQSKITSLRTQLHESQSQKSSLLTQKQSSQEKFSQVQSKLKKQEFKIQQKDQQIRNLKHLYEEKLISKNEEIRKIVQKITIMQKNAESMMKSPRKGFNDESTLQNIHKVQQENMLLKIELSKYEQRTMKLNQQLQRASMTLEKVSTQNENLSVLNISSKQREKEFREYKRQTESLNNKVKRLEEEKNMLQVKYKESLEEVKRLEYIEGECRRAKNQYEITKNQLEIKEEQYNSVCKRLQNNAGSSSLILSPRSFANEETQQKLQLYQRKIRTLSQQYESKYHQEISSLKGQLQQYKQRLYSFEQISNQDQIHEQLSQEIIRLNYVLGQRVQEILNLQKQLGLYSHKLERCEEMLSQQRNSKIRQMGSFVSQTSFIDQEKHTSFLKNQQKQIVLLNQRIRTLKESNRTMEQKLDVMVSQKIKLQHKVSELEYMRGQRSMVHHEKESHLTQLIDQVRISNERLQQSIKQIEQHYIQKVDQKEILLNKLQQQYLNQKSAQQKQLYELQSELRRLESQNREKESLLMSNQQSSIIQESQQQNFFKIKEEYEVKLVLLSQQVQRCKLIKDEKIDQTNEMKRRVQMIEDQKKQLIIENQTNKNAVEILSQQIERLSNFLSGNIEEIRMGDKQINKLELKVEQLNNELRRLRQSQKQTQTLKNFSNYVTLQQFQTLSHQHTQTKHNLATLQQQLSYTNQQLKQYQNKIQSQRRQYQQLEQQYTRLTREKRLLTQQKDSLQSKNRQLRRAQQHLKQLLSEELKKKQQSDLELIQKRSLIEEYKYKEREENTLNSLKEEIKILRQSNYSLQAKFELILTENQKLVYQVENFKRSKSNSVASNSNNKNQQVSIQEVNQLKVQNQSLRKEIQELQQRIIENNRFRGQVQGYQEQIVELQSRIKRIVQEKTQIFEELNKLQQQYKQKCQQARKFNQKSNQTEDQLHNLKGKYERITAELNSSRLQKKQLLERFNTLQKSYQNSNQQKSSPNSSSPQNNTQNTNNSSRIKAEYYTKTIKMTSIDEVDEKQQRSRGPSAHYNNLASNDNHSSVPPPRQLLQKYELLESINQKLKKENECYRKKSIQYEFKMNKLKEEFDLLSKLVNEYRDENQQLKKVNGVNYNLISKGKEQLPTSNKEMGSKTHQNFLLSNETLPSYTYQVSNNGGSSQQQQHYYSQTKISSTNNPSSSIKRSQSPEQQKPGSKDISTTNLTMTKNGSSITFRGSAMNMNEYNDLKESMHQIQTQISQRNIQVGQHSGNTQANGAVITIPIEQIHMLINEIDRLLAQNKHLSQQLNDSKVMIIKFESTRSRSDQNLATMALRHRVAVAQAQRQQMRRQNLSPARTHSNR